jgi:hypothetical protein
MLAARRRALSTECHWNSRRCKTSAGTRISGITSVASYVPIAENISAIATGVTHSRMSTANFAADSSCDQPMAKRAKVSV